MDVLIAGAGPTGLTLALELARRGVPCRVVDRAAGPFAGSRGKGLQPRTLEVFDDLGVLPDVLATGGPYPELRLYAGDTVLGDRAMTEDREPTPDVPYPNLVMSAQWRTEQVLRERLAGYGVQVEFGTELAAFAQDAGSVTATVRRAGGDDERVEAAYLVGADGGRSTVRKLLGVNFLGETLETHRALIGDVQVDGLGRDRWHVWPQAPGGVVAFCPMAGTDSFQFTVQLTGDGPVEPTLAALEGLVHERVGRDLGLHDLTFASPYRVNVRMVDEYRRGRVFLAGDAAHVHSPAGGQGLNTGLQDAYNLGWKLAHVLAGAPAALLDSYQAERLPIAAGVLGISNRLLGQALTGVRGDDTKQLLLNYRGGPLAPGSAGDSAVVQAGDRAPDAPGHDPAGAPLRLFDAFRGPHATLLAVGAGAAGGAGGAGSAVGQLGGSHSGPHGTWLRTVPFVDTDGHFARAYGFADGLVLVRPDGYVGAVGAPDVASCLDRIAPNPVPARAR